MMQKCTAADWRFTFGDRFAKLAQRRQQPRKMDQIKLIEKQQATCLHHLEER